MSRVVILESEHYSPSAIELYTRLGTVAFGEEVKKNSEEVLKEAEVLVIRLGTVSKTLLDQAPHLKVIASPTTGLNHINLEEVQKRGITIVSLKGRRDLTEKIYATSEHTIALLLGLIRRIPAFQTQVLQYGWDRQQFIGSEIAGKTVGIIGCGRLGIRVAEIVRVMGAHVIGSDPYQTQESVPDFIERVNEEALLAQSDIISLHADFRQENIHLLSQEQFMKMKEGAFFINTSRGQLVDERALLEALRSEHLAGAALDVMDHESPDGNHLQDNPLIEYAATHDNLIITPHIGGATKESMALTEESIALEVLKIFKDKK